VKPKVKVVGAEFERVIHAAPRSAHAPGLFLKPAHRSAPAAAIFYPLRSVFRSAHAPLTCSGHEAQPTKDLVHIHGQNNRFRSNILGFVGEKIENVAN